MRCTIQMKNAKRWSLQWKSGHTIILHCCDDPVDDYYSLVDQTQKEMDVSDYSHLSGNNLYI